MLCPLTLYVFVLYIKYKKYGAPIIATTIPAGTPPGCNTILPIVSAITSKHAPTKMAIGKTTGDVVQRYVWQYAGPLIR